MAPRGYEAGPKPLSVWFITCIRTCLSRLLFHSLFVLVSLHLLTQFHTRFLPSTPMLHFRLYNAVLLCLGLLLTQPIDAVEPEQLSECLFLFRKRCCDATIPLLDYTLVWQGDQNAKVARSLDIPAQHIAESDSHTIVLPRKRWTDRCS
jgi:hypothetical protein